MASTTWVRPRCWRATGSLRSCVDGAGNQALWRRWQTAPNNGWSRRASLGTPGGERVEVASPSPRMAACNFSSSKRTVRCRQVVKL